MKTWHTRWFVLKGEQLYYFKDEDEAKPLVSTKGVHGKEERERARDVEVFCFRFQPWLSRLEHHSFSLLRPT